MSAFAFINLSTLGIVYQGCGEILRKLVSLLWQSSNPMIQQEGRTVADRPGLSIDIKKPAVADSGKQSCIKSNRNQE
ncbi:hypothetical protein NDI45_15270 [Leptolyngbya sp. GB1-A1]